MKPTKNNPNSNSNNFFNENPKKNNRPNTVFRREEAPVKIIDNRSRNAGRSPETQIINQIKIILLVII